LAKAISSVLKVPGMPSSGVWGSLSIPWGSLEASRKGLSDDKNSPY